MYTLFFFLIAISVLVVIHELGHYCVARWCHVKVLRFSVGFGKVIYCWVSPKTQIEWVISALPLGGYVKMLDERDPQQKISEEDRPYAFNRQTPLKKIAIVIAGPLANFLFAIIAFAIVFMQGVPQVEPMLASPAPNSVAALMGLKGKDKVLAVEQKGHWVFVDSWGEFSQQLHKAVQNQQPLKVFVQDEQLQQHVISLPILPNLAQSDQTFKDLGFLPYSQGFLVVDVLANSAAKKAGLRPGDVLLMANSVELSYTDQLMTILKNVDHPVSIEFLRDGQKQSVLIEPQVELDQQEQSIKRIGVLLAPHYLTKVKSLHFLDSLVFSAQKTWDITRYSFDVIGQMLSGKASLKNLSGPVMIAEYAGKTAEKGWKDFLSFLALISISLGILNILPIPILDGGHLLYYAFEFVTGKAVPEHIQLTLQKAGLLCILGLSILALYNDFSRLFNF